MEKDGAAWLAWAKKQGRLEVLNRPQIMTLDNQPAIIKVGTTVPVGMPEPGAGGPARTTPIEKAEIGLTLSLTPRISPEGIVLLALNYERAWVVKRDGTVGPVIGKRTVQATVSAKDGQTIVVGGPVEARHRRRPSNDHRRYAAHQNERLIRQLSPFSRPHAFSAASEQAAARFEIPEHRDWDTAASLAQTFALKPAVPRRRMGNAEVRPAKNQAELAT